MGNSLKGVEGQNHPSFLKYMPIANEEGNSLKGVEGDTTICRENHDTR
jgi:hypothetical protein